MRTTRLFALLLICTLFSQIGQGAEYENAIISTFETDSNDTHPFHMGRRSVVFAENRSWVFYRTTASWLLWTSSNDGVTWETPYVIGQHYHWTLAYDETRNVIHLAYAGLFNSIYYRRGVPNGTLGLISWNSTATVSGAVSACSYLSIGFDEWGYIYLSYANGTSADQPYISRNNDNSTGAWVMAVGFPYAINSTGTWLARTQLNVLENNNVLVAYRAQSSPPSDNLYSRLYCRNGTWNAQTQATATIVGGTIGYSMVSVGNDTYLAYDTHTTNAHFTVHNYTTLSWNLGGETALWGRDESELCYDYINGRVYRFSHGYLDDSMLNITYYDLSNQTWVTQQEIEESITLQTEYLTGTATIDQYGRMGFAWAQTLNPPFDLRFAWLSPDLTPPPPPPPYVPPPMPDLVSMYIWLGFLIIGVLLMFYAVFWVAWGIKKKGVTPDTIERGGYGMLIWIVGFGMTIMFLYSGA